jgi:acyl-CoA thioesterase FadM
MTTPGTFALTLPRNAFSPREAARGADLWRACQDVAVWESTRVGWPPSRYRDEGTSFLVRTMSVVHHRETSYGEPLTGRTWVSRIRREMFSTREVRIEGAAGPVCDATQEWVHVAADLSPTRAPRTLLDAFPIDAQQGASVAMPALAVSEPDAPVHALRFRCWHVWMDPLAHVNHPMYVDFADESLACVVARAGISPVALVPVAETATYRAGVTADVEVCVESRLAGMTASGDVVVTHRVLGTGGELCATLTTVRRLLAAPAERLRDALLGR